MPIIELSDISFNYHNETVLNNISFAINKGDYVGIIGPNGGGKTTLLKIILGLIKPLSGQVKLFDQDINNFIEWSKIGYVSQRFGHTEIDVPVTVEEVVQQGRVNKIGFFKSFSSVDTVMFEQAMVISNIQHLKHKLIGELSQGEKQRVLIARAICGEPEILILDEPVAGVDLLSQEKFYTFIKDLNKKGLTIIFVTHEIDVLADQVSSMLCLNRSLVCHGHPHEVFKEDILKKLYDKNIKLITHGH